MSILHWKALHLIFVVTWFAGLFYIVRLLIYHQQAQEKPENERKILSQQLKIMERRLWYGITYPSMLLTLLFGGILLYNGWKIPAGSDFVGYHAQPWIYAKLTFVAALIGYHLYCGYMVKKAERDQFPHSNFWLRLWNEGATLFLVAIIFLAVLKNTLDFWYAILGFFIFSLILVAGIYGYRSYRERKT